MAQFWIIGFQAEVCVRRVSDVCGSAGGGFDVVIGGLRGPVASKISVCGLRGYGVVFMVGILVEVSRVGTS